MRSLDSHEYHGVTRRTLQVEERRIRVDDEQTPLVLQADSSSGVEFLQDFLKTHSEQILSDVATAGAVLLRGFAVRSDIDFERTILSIRGVRPMCDVLMRELGRDIVPGTNFVFFTNAIVKTGGSLDFAYFHTENYYTTDVPRFIFFWCSKPPWVGGETGLINTRKVCDDLPNSLKVKLASKAFPAAAWPLARIAKTHNVSVDQVSEFCKNHALRTTNSQGDIVALVYKASIFQNPATGHQVFQFNEREIPGLTPALKAAFGPDYPQATWLLHKLWWRFPGLARASRWIQAAAHPVAVARRFSALRRSRGTNNTNGAQGPTRVGSAFSADETAALATSMHRHYSSFQWQRGDVLLVDNVGMAHGGMPGFGPRRIRSLIANALPLNYSPDAAGVQALTEEHVEPLGALLQKPIATS